MSYPFINPPHNHHSSVTAHQTVRDTDSRTPCKKLIQTSHHTQSGPSGFQTHIVSFLYDDGSYEEFDGKVWHSL